MLLQHKLRHLKLMMMQAASKAFLKIQWQWVEILSKVLSKALTLIRLMQLLHMQQPQGSMQSSQRQY